MSTLTARQMPLSEKNGRIWRAICATALNGMSMQEVVEKFKGVYDVAPLANGIRALVECGYIAPSARGRYARYTITEKIPRGHQRPVFLDEQEDREPKPHASVTLPDAPVSIFTLCKPSDPSTWVPAGTEPPAEAPAPSTGLLPQQQPQKPARFTLTSDGCLYIDGPGLDAAVTLPPDVTRPMFRWLDRLGGTNLQRTVEVTAP